MTIHVAPRSHPVLVLNADHRPLSYFPLSLWSWQDAVKAVFMDRVNVVETYDVTVRSARRSMALPSVVSLKTFVQARRAPAFTRFNVFLRDRFRCQYCGSREDLTFDHLVPRSRGGQTSWENIVTACSACNLRKADRSPEEVGLRPAHRPWRPSVHDLHAAGRQFPPNFLHESWMDHLYWDVELDP
ncbi:MAG: HNH endonuclease [Siculibacillus sp.]